MFKYLEEKDYSTWYIQYHYRWINTSNFCRTSLSVKYCRAVLYDKFFALYLRQRFYYERNVWKIRVFMMIAKEAKIWLKKLSRNTTSQAAFQRDLRNPTILSAESKLGKFKEAAEGGLIDCVILTWFTTLYYHDGPASRLNDRAHRSNPMSSAAASPYSLPPPPVCPVS